MHVNFYANRMLFTISSINSFLMDYLNYKNLNLNNLIDNMAIDIRSPCLQS